MTVFRLLAVDRGAAGTARHLDAPMVGREGELQQLNDAFASMLRQRQCALFTLLGVPGVGKSRLVREFLSLVDARVVEGRCMSYGEGITYSPVVEVVRQLDEADRLLAGSPGAAAAIGALLGELDAITTTDEISWAVRKLLESASRERPLVVVFDDIHWGEPTFLDLIEQIADLCQDAPILLLCSARLELLDERPGWGTGKPNATTVLLEPLDAGETDALLERLLGGQRIEPGLAERIRSAAEGNPLFLEEMLAMVRESSEGEVVVPPTVRALLAARLDQLAPGERSVLERGSVEGQLFHSAAVVALARDLAPVGRELAALVRKELVRPDRPRLEIGDAYRFRHLLLRDAAYEALPKAARAELHERFAEWLAAHGADLVERDEMLGYHLEQSYRYHSELGPLEEEARALGERAAGRLVSAGNRAIARGDLRAAANLLERALAVGLADPRERVRVQAELGNALGETRRMSEADAVLVEAHDEATALGERGAAALALVYRYSFRYSDLDFESMRPGLDQAVETFGELGDERGVALARRMLGVAIERRQGRWAVGVAELERALVHAEACGDPATRRRVIGSLLAGLVSGPTPVDEAIDRCEALLPSSRDDRVLEAVLKRRLGEFYAMAARFEEALELVRESSVVLDELDQLTVSTLYRGGAAYAKQLAGDLAGAEQELTARWHGFRNSEPGQSRTELMASSELGHLYCDSGRWDDAKRVAYGGDLTLQPFGDGRVKGLALQGRLAAREGRVVEGLTLARQAVELADETDSLNWRAEIRVTLAEVERASGAIDQAQASVETALALYEQKGNIAAAAALRARAVAGSPPGRTGA